MKKKAFREDCARIWGNLYDYSMTKYQDNHTPVLIGCPLHGVFRLRPRDHLQRRLGCPKCGSSIPGSVDGSAAAVLKAFSKTPRLGQHLLQSYAVADAIARAAVGSGGSGGWVAEIGVGTGILTSALLRRPECTGVVGFEMDEEILKEGFARGGALHRCGAVPGPRLSDEALSWSRADWTEALRSSSNRCQVLKGNVLNFQIPGHCQTVVGNIPYRISSALISKLLRQEPPLERIVLMVQLEFAKQLMAKPGGTQQYCEIWDAFSAMRGLRSLRGGHRPSSPRVLQPCAPCGVASGAVGAIQGTSLQSAAPGAFPLRALLGPKTSKDAALETALDPWAEELPSRWRVALGGAQLDPAMRVAELSVEDLVKLCNALVSSYITPPHQLRVKMRPGKSHEDLFEGKASKKSHKSGSSIIGALQSLLGGEGAGNVVKASDGEETIHIFSVASGHLYEKLLGIMILSVRNNTQNPLHFWFIDNFLSPKFKAFIPMMAQRYDFKYDFVTYKWPSWLNPQSEKQRLIWAYKILFLDVLFPQDVPKIIFIDADQVVRADVKELWDLDLQGKVYGFVPMGDSNPDTEGFRFWKQGYWKSHLGTMPYHISALFVVDLVEFRRTSTGETLRGVYNQADK
ncbi:unnamed protein product, partial [Cladocopium goreaui]